MKQDSNLIAVPAGMYTDILNYQGVIDVYDQRPGVPNPRNNDNYYSKGVGLVKSVSHFAYSNNTIEKKLLRYHIN